MPKIGRLTPRMQHGCLGGMLRSPENGPTWDVEQAENSGVNLIYARHEIATTLYFSDEDAYHIGMALLRNSTYDPEAPTS